MKTASKNARDNPTQSERFVEAAQAHCVDGGDALFEAAMKAVTSAPCEAEPTPKKTTRQPKKPAK